MVLLGTRSKEDKPEYFHLQRGFRVRFQFCNSALKGVPWGLRACCDLMGEITQALPEFYIFIILLGAVAAFPLVASLRGL